MPGLAANASHLCSSPEPCTWLKEAVYIRDDWEANAHPSPGTAWLIQKYRPSPLASLKNWRSSFHSVQKQLTSHDISQPLLQLDGTKWTVLSSGMWQEVRYEHILSRPTLRSLLYLFFPHLPACGWHRKLRREVNRAWVPESPRGRLPPIRNTCIVKWVRNKPYLFLVAKVWGSLYTAAGINSNEYTLYLGKLMGFLTY